MVSIAARHVRPRLHITVPYWLNDPCAPAYDSNTGLYHLFYQCNPFSTNWANMSWGHVTSKDLLHWTFVPDQPALKPDQVYDKDGVFTGCMAPIGRDKKLYAFYSSICQLPFHWSTPPFPRNSAGLAMATSEDGGRTWFKSRQNPILAGEPQDMAVSGFRDPYVAPWKELDVLRGTNGDLYGLVSGGLHGVGPTSFLYAIKPDALTKWNYLGPLVDLSLDWKASPKWGGSFGVNWECVNFMTLSSQHTGSCSDAIKLDFLLAGAECAAERSNVRCHKVPAKPPPRAVRTQMWLQGHLRRSTSGDIRFVHTCSGLFDHGSYYAANSFVDPKTHRRIVYGWIPDEDCSASHAEEKGWNGAQALPREVFIQLIPNVVGALRSPLKEITSVNLLYRNGHYSNVADLYTMGIRPIDEFLNLRSNTLDTYRVDPFSSGKEKTFSKHIVTAQNPTWELEALIAVNPSCKQVGFHLNHSHDLAIRTSLIFDVSEENIILDCSQSIADPTLLPHVNMCSDSGPFTLFTTPSSPSSVAELEKLHIRIFKDSNVLEIFVNERFSIGTMTYTGNHESCGGITAFAISGDDADDPKSPSNNTPAAVFESLTVWDGLNAGESLIDGWEHVRRAEASLSGDRGSVPRSSSDGQADLISQVQKLEADPAST